MIHAWYESHRDAKDHIYFEKTVVNKGRASLGNYKTYPHFHNSIELAFGLKGNIPIVIDGKRYTLGEGDICVANSMEPHKYFYTEGDACYVVLISSSFFNDVNRLGSISFPSYIPASEATAVIKRFLDYAIDTWDGESLLCKRGFADELAYLMLRYFRVAPKREVEKQSAMPLGAVQYICEHYTEHLTVSEVARKFGYSANYFSTAFNEFMGVSFPDYLNACRMIEYTRIHRENPSLPACKIAKMCGFGSMNTFYRAQNAFAKGRTFGESEKGGSIYERSK